ncbi:hypothetical protein SAMN05216368_10638 [Cryobacterium flavum]|uniref:Sodium-dependent bicarbonate transport family permease n=1 Tax=Cryobacterium flavum TaxID=1424659 RepID=A0A5E9FYH4_9MICO|nr:sodium-dependent bicarbonate transport family permease [Cryobacterium flavum]SDN56029.1 hypothetical protein SAMN05216368_10638 [Cryobacterium flavum]
MIDPIILFFLLGAVAGLLRSELRLPAAMYEFVSIVLLLAIGLKDGVELAKQPFANLLPQMLAVVTMGFGLTLLAFPVLRYLGRFKRADAASIAAHYGSVSVGTYAVAVAYLGSQQISFEEHMPLLLVLLEVPAILVGIVLARGISRKTRWKSIAHEVFLRKGIVLLLAGLLIGGVAGPDGLSSIEALIVDLFKGILALFLLEMGLIKIWCRSRSLVFHLASPLPHDQDGACRVPHALLTHGTEQHPREAATTARSNNENTSVS